MIEILSQYQADTMLVLSSICGAIALFVFLTDTLSRRRKSVLFRLELCAMFLLIADRRAYIFRGDPSALGWWVVRISNFLVFFLTLAVIYCFNLYLIDLYTHEGKLEKAPRLLTPVKVLALIGMGLVIVSQFTGLYYTFDETNRYQRAPGFLLCFAIPLTILLLQIIVILRYRDNLNRRIRFSLLVFSVGAVISSVLQVFLYGISLNNIAIALMAALLYVFAIQNTNREMARARETEIEFYRQSQEKEHALFEQTAEALASAIDAKDKYTHGHSSRVAMYASQIARGAGMNDEECDQVYFAGLLHDVGKIGVSDAIINKDGRLTDEEFNWIKRHPEFGSQILNSIQQSPYLSIGAHYHHERYDGRGYPNGLKGEKIPRIARIIAVADAYDAMTSKRSYRDPLPQSVVTEEIVKGAGTQFDPLFAHIMLRLIDADVNYHMREHGEETDDMFISRLRCESIYHECTVGFRLTETLTRIRLFCRAEGDFPVSECLPTLLLFDALDGRVHEDAPRQKDLHYMEYCRVRFDGLTLCECARETETQVIPEAEPAGHRKDGDPWTAYEIEAFRQKDHVMIRVSNGLQTVQTIAALQDSIRFAYLSLTGEHCMITNLRVDQDADTVPENSIPRIAEEISYIQGFPEGDVPNLQIDGWRTQTTAGIPVTDRMTLTFHARSLPMASLIWHCPYIVLFTSADGRVGGEGYREFLMLRLDGEHLDSPDQARNLVESEHTPAFDGWNEWKKRNREGFDCRVDIQRAGSVVTIGTENLGISMSSVTTLREPAEEIYAALTGDLCTVTDIRVRRPA